MNNEENKKGTEELIEKLSKLPLTEEQIKRLERLEKEANLLTPNDLTPDDFKDVDIKKIKLPEDKLFEEIMSGTAQK